MSTATRALTQQHRAQQLLLRRATVSQVKRIAPALDWSRLDATYPGFAVQVASVVQANHRTSAGLTASYLRSYRKADGIPGSFDAELAPFVVEQFNASLSATSIAALKTSSANGVPADVALSNALTQYTGAMARLVLNGGRETFTQTIKADPKALGYERVLGGVGCEFCQMLADRGAVYGAESVDFEAHDHCGCSGEPVYAA